MKTFVLALIPAAMTACASEGATPCSEERFRENWGTFTTCCEDIGEDGHVYVYGIVDPAGEQGGNLVIRRYFDRSGPPCVTDEGTTDCGCSSGATPACEDDDTSCTHGQTGSATASFFIGEDAVVFVPRGARESALCGVDRNGAADGGTVREGPASLQEYTGRQKSYASVTGVVPEAYSECYDGVPGVALTLQASCTGDVTGTLTWGAHSVTCSSDAGGDDVVESRLWAELDATVEVEHSSTGWQGWAEACEGVGACELVMSEDRGVRGNFGG